MRFLSSRRLIERNNMRDCIEFFGSAFAIALLIASIGDPLYAIGGGLVAIAAAIAGKKE